MSNPPTHKGPSQGQAAPRDPRRRPRTTAAGPGRQDPAGEAFQAPRARDVTTDVRAAYAPPLSVAPISRQASLELAAGPRRAPPPLVSRAPVAAPSRPAPAHSSRSVETSVSRDLAAAASREPRAAAPARAHSAARAPRGLAAEHAAGAVAGQAVGAASTVTQHTQHLRSMPSLEALEDQPMDGKTEAFKRQLAWQIHRTLEAMDCSTKEGLEKVNQEAERSNRPLSKEEANHLATIKSYMASARPQRSRRTRYSSEFDSDTEESKRQCVGDSEIATVEMACDDDIQSSRPTTPAPSRTAYADKVRKTPSPQPTNIPSAGRTQPPTTAPGPKQRYPPLIVENLPNWTTHIKAMKGHLGRSPNVRPFGKGVKFTPTEDQEFRYIQRYLTSLEKTEKISWFSYSLPSERNIKVAIRGLPADTDPEDIKEDLRGQGFDPEYVRPIHARRGRPGCIFLGYFRRTRSIIPELYRVTEIMGMPGIIVEAWRGKKGPSQCFRCQGFRHSSQNCHRQQACVRCGLSHSARDCPRPLAEPATCANCNGPHPANHVRCPVFRKEARNKRAGTIASTTTPKAAKKPSAAAPQGSNIRTPANEPRDRGSAARRRKPRGRRGSRPEQKPQDQPRQHAQKTAPTAKKSGEKKRDKDAVLVAIEVLHEVLLAVRDGRDPTPIIVRGLADIISSKAD